MSSRALVADACLTLLACQPPDEDARKGNLTLGVAQMKLESGRTTKVQVLEWFGAPNVATRDKDGEVWNYTRQASTYSGVWTESRSWIWATCAGATFPVSSSTALSPVTTRR
jgi:outer membrane protein assembly factor BamE (lipoprotein component of BamABCDE complex)